jgi:hypothetical protein
MSKIKEVKRIQENTMRAGSFSKLVARELGGTASSVPDLVRKHGDKPGFDEAVMKVYREHTRAHTSYR